MWTLGAPMIGWSGGCNREIMGFTSTLVFKARPRTPQPQRINRAPLSPINALGDLARGAAIGRRGRGFRRALSFDFAADKFKILDHAAGFGFLADYPCIGRALQWLRRDVFRSRAECGRLCFGVLCIRDRRADGLQGVDHGGLVERRCHKSLQGGVGGTIPLKGAPTAASTDRGEVALGGVPVVDSP